jgi:hypothetical protein
VKAIDGGIRQALPALKGLERLYGAGFKSEAKIVPIRKLYPLRL